MTWGSGTWGSYAWGENALITATPRALSKKIYRMLIRGLRTMDEQSQGILERICDILDTVWEDRLYKKGTELFTLAEIDNIDERWLPYLAPLLGFTNDLMFSPTAAELRKILLNATVYFNEKPSEMGVIDNAIRLVTGAAYRVVNYFDLRMQLDKTCLTEESENFDPWGLDFNYRCMTGKICNTTTQWSFELQDLSRTFKTENEYSWLKILTGSNRGVYPIDLLLKGTQAGIVKLQTPFPVPVTSGAEWLLLAFTAAYESDVRIVDEGAGYVDYDAISGGSFSVGDWVYGDTSGAWAHVYEVTESGLTGRLKLRQIHGRFIDNEVIQAGSVTATINGETHDVLNRELVKFLMDLVRPTSERINLFYIDFTDQFLTPNDLDKWTVTSVTVPSPGGAALFQAGSCLVDNALQGAYWGDQIAIWKVQCLAAGIAELLFWSLDVDNQYFVKLDYSTQEVSVWKNVAGVLTQLGSTVVISYLKVGIQDGIRVDCLRENTATRIRVHVNGERELDVTDSVGVFQAGRVGMRCTSGQFKLLLTEVNCLPIEMDRIGPNP